MMNFIKSILAGVAIGIGSYINLKTGGITGAILFRVGLFLVCHFQLNLYTGKVGYTGIIKNLLILLGNFIGSLFLLFMPQNTARYIMEDKLSEPLHVTFINAIICGILIYAAVECFRRGSQYMIVVCVPAFIAFGAEHCVADMCYAANAHMFSWRLCLFMLIVILGNSIGSILFRLCTKGE